MRKLAYFVIKAFFVILARSWLESTVTFRYSWSHWLENSSTFDARWRSWLQSTYTFGFIEAFDCDQYILLCFVETVDCNRHRLLCVIKSIDCNQWLLLNTVGFFDSSFLSTKSARGIEQYFCVNFLYQILYCQYFWLILHPKFQDCAPQLATNHLWIVIVHGLLN